MNQLRPVARIALSIPLCVLVTLASGPVRAGDILRGGGILAPQHAATPGGTNSGSTSQARANAQDALARTTQALQSVQAMQNAARRISQHGPANLGPDPKHPGMQLPNVPNGLTPGGLQVAPKVPIDLAHPAAGEDASLWLGAKLPVQTAANGQIQVTIEQTAPQALLTWQTFNIGSNTALRFNQSAGGIEQTKWIAFNKINDPTGVPSQILGSIQATGQVYVINRNGIIFGGGSQINLHALVASALPINDNLIGRGLLNNPDAQFLFSSLQVTAAGVTTPYFLSSPAPGALSVGPAGDVTVQKGATISSPTTPEHIGGRVALIGANVTNDGTVSTPDGQTILAAGQQVALAAHASSDPSLRGLDVYIGAVDSASGAATNSGLIEAPHADVTIAGKTVGQLGVIDSLTSVALNGRVDLLANYNAKQVKPPSGTVYLSPSEAGTVTLGPGSVTRILPELESKDTVVGIQLALPSQINVQGEVIHLAKDSQILAPNAAVTLNAGNWLPGNPGFLFTNATGQVYLDGGAAINVAGSIDVTAPVSENIVSVQLRGTELADSPLQRSGPFRGETIRIDIRQSGLFNGQTWVGTPLADASGYVGIIQRTVGELTTNGGTVKVTAGGSVVLQSSATIDVSGGWINYQGGVVETSRVLADGHIYDISQATPDRLYDGVYKGTFTTLHQKWGLTETFTNPLLTGAHFENGYTYGGNGGTIAITAPSMALDGSLLGNTVAGPRQRYVAPKAGGLSLVFQSQDTANYPGLIYPTYSPTPPNIVFQQGGGLKPADPFALDNFGNPVPLSADRTSRVVLSPDLLTSAGFGFLKIDNSDGDITVPAGVSLTAQAGSSITLAAANLNIEGTLTAPGGNLALSVFDFSPYKIPVIRAFQQNFTPPPDATRGHFTLGSAASLSTAGLIVDDRPSAPDPLTLPVVPNGGTITINSYTVTLVAGSSIDVSGGVVFGPTGKRTYGTGGSIDIRAGQDPNLASLLGGHLVLDASLSGFSGDKGGALSVLAPLVQIGGVASKAGTLLLSPDFFSQGGFSSFTLTGLGAATGQAEHFVPAINIAPGTVLAPVAQSWVAVPFAPGDSRVTLRAMLQPEGIRPPVSLSFNAPGVIDGFSKSLVFRGDIVLGERASILTDPGGSVSLSGNTVAVLGSITAPGGSIVISGGKSFVSDFPAAQALPTVDLGPHSVLSAAGTTVLTPDPRGYRTGIVLPGGSISVSGNIVAEAGSRLDVSGASDVLDLPPGNSADTADTAASVAPVAPLNGSFKGYVVVPTRVDSNGGSIFLSGGQELFTNATLVGDAGGPSARGGSLTVSSGRFYPQGSNPPTPLDVTLELTQHGSAIPSHFYPAGQTAIGVAVPNGPSLGHFAVDDFSHSGFDSLTLKGTVQFSGPVTLSAAGRLTIGDSGIVLADPGVSDSALTLRAPYVVLGTPFLPPLPPLQQGNPVFSVDGRPFYAPPTFGTGSLSVTASLIDIGNLSLQNIGRADFTAVHGDIRGDGTLDVAGELTMRAGQIYPTTGVSFTISVNDYVADGSTHSGSVTFAASGNRQLPLSAGGVLSVYGSIINQGGILRAPIGTINLGWDGSGSGPKDLISGRTVVPTQQLTLSKGSVTSVSAVDPMSGREVLIPYGANLNGTAWIDPAGTDITAGGVPAKLIKLGALSVTDQVGALIDIRGGGDLFAYRWVPGIGGSKDVLATTTSFAIIPGYGADFAPVDPGYANKNLLVGDRIHLDASNGVPGGDYTLLPARYALLPGAFLVTPKSGTPVGAQTLPDGASLVSGYRFNDLNPPQSAPLTARFELAPASVVRARAEYDTFSANEFLSLRAQELGSAVPRLPVDSGQLVLAATQAMSIQGVVLSRAVSSGLGSIVDISSPVDILISGPGATAQPGALVLDASQLSAIGAGSLLIGGIRQAGANGTTVTVKTGRLTVDNASAPLIGPDIILVASKNLTLKDGAVIEQTGGSSGGDGTLLIGQSGVAGSGDGTLLRVGSDLSSSVVRFGVDASKVPAMVIGAGAIISGASVTLDSSYATTLDPNASLIGSAVNLGSGQISLQLTNAGGLLPTAGLVLSGNALQTLQNSAQSLSLLSYSSIDIYGTGQIGALDTAGNPLTASLALHAAEIRGFNNGGGTVTFAAQNILLDNTPGRVAPGAVAGQAGTLAFKAGTIRLGVGQLKVDQFSNLSLNASSGILGQNTGGLSTQGNLDIATRSITGAAAADQTISAGGALTMNPFSGAGGTPLTGGLGASLSFFGTSIADNVSIVLPSGALTLHATVGDLQVGNSAATKLDAAGTKQTFFDLVKYTGGGTISLISDNGSIRVSAGSTVTVASQPEGGDAGSLSVVTPKGSFNLAGTLLGKGGAGGRDGTFSLDVGSLASLKPLETTLAGASFTESQTIRVRAGNVLVDGPATAHTFNLSADQGAITVTGKIDATGADGGTINLQAGGGVTLAADSVLTVAGQNFNHAGKGGAVSLETRGNGGATIDIQTGSTIDLSVTNNTADSASRGDFTGTLHLRAPQTAGSTDLQVSPVNGSILNASSIVIEGYKVFDLTNSGGAITAAVETNIRNNGALFGGNTAAAAMTARIFAGGPAASLLHFRPGAEIINTGGDLTLAGDWDLSTFRFGTRQEPGVLTMRASGNLIFNGSLSDGFLAGGSNPATGEPYQLWQEPLLPAGVQSWSYRLAAGADFSAADFRRVKPLASLAAGSGSLMLGKDGGINVSNPFGPDGITETAIDGHYQVIRTGAGEIEISAGRDVKLLNPFATIYTAGAKVSDPTMGGAFDTPRLFSDDDGIFPYYPAQYSLGGGNVTIAAQWDIQHLTRDIHGVLVPDSERQMPINWLNRRGFVDPATGQFGRAAFGDVASTSWWIDFSNFFEGVGALGGGNVTLIAGHDISNVDALVPTNARMPKGTPDTAKLLELGGGDLLVRAGHDIDGGVYYVERGRGTLTAGNSIHTNSTRSPSLTNITNPSTVFAPETWLPTTLFLGKGRFDVAARTDLTLGPVANPFLLPQGMANSFFYKTYFSTYATTDSVNVSSLAGKLTLRENATLPVSGIGSPLPMLQIWFQNELLLTNDANTASFYQPWLRLAETSVDSFSTVAALMPATLRASAFSGDINIVGRLTLSPSPRGTVELAAAGSVNGLQINGVTGGAAGSLNAWGSGGVNLSDASPALVYGIDTPLAFQAIVGTNPSAASQSGLDFLLNLNSLFAESGATLGLVQQSKQALHAPGVLHAGDTEPVRLYARDGDISGVTVFSSKAARIISGQDITDIALYIQNDSSGDVSLVASGRDIVAYNPNSPLRVQARSPGNALNFGDTGLAGDIQISGPGTLEVLAGQNLDLGVGPSNKNGTAVGIASVGNARNPYLPFEGANIVGGAGIGPSTGLAGSALDFTTFLSGVATGGGGTGTDEQQNLLALDTFYLTLRNAGRDHNDPASAGFGNYNAGFAAIAALFPNDSGKGDISLTSREIKTQSGGNISLFAPGGKLTVGFDVSGNQAADQGVLTQDGGNISIFTRDSVIVGTSRIFTLRGGNVVIWSSAGDIAAGASSKTVQSAPPTRVLIDPQSADIQTDLAGLATGGGIGVLATVLGVKPGDVDLIAPAGTIDAGDAGIRVSGNLNISALHVVNADNIQVGGASLGVPTPQVTAPNLSGLTTAANTAAAGTSSADEAAKQAARNQSGQQEEMPSIITVEVVGYGGGDGA